MRAAVLIREARRRAGLTQRELADRLGTTQSAIARLERGRTEPSCKRVVDAVRACGLELVAQLLPADEADSAVASTSLLADPETRARRATRPTGSPGPGVGRCRPRAPSLGDG
jgi:transcriptional regulator with XRE-family HTH domain